MFHFPKSISLQEEWTYFLKTRLYTQSCICIKHFEDKYIAHHSNRQRLNYSLAPIPTIHPSAIPKSQKILPKKPRKLLVKIIYQEDELQRFRAKKKIETIQDIALFFNSCDEYKGLKIDIQNSHVAAYRVEFRVCNPGIPIHFLPGLNPGI